MMQLGIYDDDTYKRDATGVSGERTFVRFMANLAPHVDRLVIAGRLDPDPGHSHYPLGAEVEFGGRPYYASLTHPLQVMRSLKGSAVGFWRLLDRVDTVWLLGPYIHAIGFALLALMRRRKVVLGVRQDLPRYVRSRHPNARWVHASADILELIFRALTRWLPVAVVGPDLAKRYAHAGRLLELTVSLVAAADIVAEPEALTRAAAPVRRLLSVGRLDREKNPLLLIEVMAALHETDSEWRLVIAGDGPLRPEIEARVEELALTDAVDVRGYVPIDGELPALYQASDAFLHVSWTEGVPQVLFEAFAAGLPVVATDVGGVAQAVDGAALLVPPGDSRAAASALLRVAEEGNLRRSLILQGLERVRDHTLEVETRRLATFLEGG
jgi:glycosyltransferase involved in cell wall biosynthesis